LDLPEGFSYRVLSRAGERMHDGYHVPGNPDAMGVFATDAGLVLMRNHEVMPGDRAKGPYPPGVNAPTAAYDAAAYGGVTRVVLDPDTLAIRRQELALCGTHWNCAGGLSPWGWLTCEEIFAPDHGYVFLAPHTAHGLTHARPLKQFGHFRHEAASIDPATSIAYLTEDREDAALYRFLPGDRARPFEGRLQALRVIGQPGFDVNVLPVGRALPIDWVDVPDPDSRQDDVRLQARARGAARFARTEGLWLTEREAFVCATAGGPIARGQILCLDHASRPQTLRVVAQSDDPNVLDMPDNITVAPSGDLYIAEDGLEGNYLRRITPDGHVVDFARNALSASELTGPCFSPDGETLFINLQHDGLTLAVRGPFADEGAFDPPGSQRAAARSRTAGFGGLGAGLAILGLAALMHRRRHVAHRGE
jgi:secreted PhoX family phosphatase